MEGPSSNTESLESFEKVKSRIKEIFEREGLSENLKSIIENWHSRRYEETDRSGGTMKERVEFQIELAQIYITTERSEYAIETLNDAKIEAYQGSLDELVETIDNLLGSIN